ncbi:sacsin N-terminal ATP-binding-like domain-containing protein [Flindersiella endophytica]
MNDPFATTAIRERVLAAWSAAPVRFREDANTEEDYALGGHRERLLVELAQNAADAAGRAGVPGRLRLTLREGDLFETAVLVAANTGAPLDAEGVESLATLRASAKRDDTAVGRFGVGFAAVLSASDEPIVLSRTGGVRFSRGDTAELVAEAAQHNAALGEELRRRDGHVPVLRLPFAAEGEPPAGFDTAVVLALRDEPAVDLVRRLLAEVDDALLLALPGLTAIEIDTGDGIRELSGADERWAVHRAAGIWTDAERGRLLADRPTEERARLGWSMLWAAPLESGAAMPATLHAPTPTDEPVSLPALLLASFPLDPTRRHVAPGPLSDRLVELAAEQYAEFVRQRAEDGADVVALVPVGLPAGPLDGVLRDAILQRLPGTPMLRSVEDPEILLRPRDAVTVEDAGTGLVRVLAPIVSGLVPPASRAAYDALGVRRLPLADLVDELAAVGGAHPPQWWRELYSALDEAVLDPRLRDALGSLPVPLADGRLVRGARGLVLPTDSDVQADALGLLAEYGLRVVHPDAVHETLERLGAVAADPRTLLGDGAIRTAVRESADDEGMTDAVLAVVAAAVAKSGLRPGELPWLGALALRDDEDEPTPADGLVLPGSEAQAILDPDAFAPVDAGLVERWGADVLRAVGVIGGLGLVQTADADLLDLPDELDDLHDFDTWAEEHGAGAGGLVSEVHAIRDLDFVDDEQWPRALRLIANDTDLRRALLEPANVVLADGTGRRVRSYTAWWIRLHVELDGVPIGALADPEASPALAALLEPPPAWLAEIDPEARTGFGLIRGVGDLDPVGVGQVLARLADPEVELDAAAMLALWDQLGAIEDAFAPVEAPDQVRVLAGEGTRVVDHDEAVVVDSPMWLQRTDLGGLVVASKEPADRLADLLDLPLASELAEGELAAEGVLTDVPDAVRTLLPEAPEHWLEHEELEVDGQPVDWWVDAAGRPHAATVEGLARALAWSADRWTDRFLVEAVLSEPERVGDLLADRPFD